MKDLMDYQALNQHLAQLLSQFDLNQKVGGCSLVIFHQGKAVTQLAHGIANIDKTNQQVTPWQPSTLSLNFSTGKGILVTLIHILVSQKLLAYDKTLASYWPAFAQNGKDNITLRDILTHESGLFNIVSITEHAKDMLDWQLMLSKVEQMALNSPTNTHSSGNGSANKDSVNQSTKSSAASNVAYSALVSGWVLGGLIAKVTQLSLQQALEYYLLQPLDLVGQVYFGVPKDIIEQVAGQIRAKETQVKPLLTQDADSTLHFYQSLPFYPAWLTLSQSDSPLTTQAINALYFQPANINIEDYKSALVPIGSRQFNYYHPVTLQAKIPAANGVASALALATVYAMLANRGIWQGKTLINSAVFKALSTIHNEQFDKIMPAVMAWRLGYHRVFSLFHDVSDAFGHMGYNG
ncbi:MAG TPA: serine hydrolase, partial [Moraxellaceae bacterium]|nr:serine hydrolase [Moraxellaceae bacterium]